MRWTVYEQRAKGRKRAKPRTLCEVSIEQARQRIVLSSGGRIVGELLHPHITLGWKGISITGYEPAGPDKAYWQEWWCVASRLNSEEENETQPKQAARKET